MNNILLKIGLLAAMLSAILTTTAHDFEVNGIYYNITSSSANTVAVTYRGKSPGEYANDYIGTVVIPSSITYNNKSYSVTSIDEYAFRYCSALASVVIPNSVTSIGNYAFSGCSALASVVIPNSVTSIGSCAFDECSSLASVEIPNSVTTIYDCAFDECSSLASVEIPNSVTYIGYSAFRRCSSLESLTFNATNCVTFGSYEDPVFPSSISSLTIGDNVIQIPDDFLYNGSKIQNLTIPNSVTYIGHRAFRNCDSLASVKIPNSVTYIGNDAFSGCSSLASVEIPNSITTIFSAFSGCSSLTSIVIPNSVTSIENYAFSGCSSLTSVEIPNSVTSIGDGAFRRCSSLNYIEIPNSVTSIGNDAFSGCSSLESVIIPNSVTYIGYRAFSGNFLKSVTLGAGLFSIGPGAFSRYDYNRIAKAFWLGNTPPSGYEEVNAYVNYVSNDQYNLNNQIKYQFLGSKFTVDGIVYVPVSPSERTCDIIDCLYNNAYTTGVVSDKVTHKGIEMTVNKIQQYAFYGLSTISEINIPNSITDLGASAFEGCSALKSATLGSGFNTLPTKVFSGCSSLESIAIPDNVSSISDYAFKGCYSLADISIADSRIMTWISLGSNGSSPLFADCPLDEVYIGRSLSYKTGSNYGYSPFYRNTSLRTVEITDAETWIYDNEFYGCSGLKSLKIGNGVTTIGTRAFSGCSAMRSFECGEKAKSIGEEAFSDCTGLKYFTSKAITPPVCGTQALDDINKWECTLRVPQESIDDYQQAAQWKEFFFIEDLSKILAEEIELNTSEAEVNVGSTLHLYATIFPANATNQALVWESSDVSVADVNAQGLVTGLKEGTATITVRSADGNAEATCVLTVKDMSGIDTVNAPSAYTLVKTPNGYIVRNACGARIEVYSADGRMVYLAPSYTEEEIALPAGLYIVRAANRAWKVRF